MVKSVHYPNEIIATRKGSPLLIGVKTEQKLKVDFVDVEFINDSEPSTETSGNYLTSKEFNNSSLRKSESRAILPDHNMPIEFLSHLMPLRSLSIPRKFCSWKMMI